MTPERDTQPVVAWNAAPSPHDGTALPALRTAIPGPRGRAWVDDLAAHECPGTTARRGRRAEEHGVERDPVVWERARGSNVWDPDGNRYVDLTGGFAVVAAGHAHPFVTARVREQLETLVHGLGDAFPSTVRIELARRLAELTPGALGGCIFASSGSESVEAAIKTAVLATGRGRLIAFEDGYHGMTLGTLPVSHYREGFRAPFRSLLVPFADHMPWGEALDPSGEPPAAVLVEPVQGRGGCRLPPTGWLRHLRQFCDQTGALLIFDEIFTGFGRAGELFLAGSPAADGVIPDLLCIGKGLTSGFPLSACLGTPEAMGAWGMSRGEAIHTSTFLGHPVGCAAGLAVLDLFEHHGLLHRARTLAREMGRDLVELAGRRPDRIVAIRGDGAMRGVELRGRDPMAVCGELLRCGYLSLPSGGSGDVVGLTPPLTMTRAQWKGALEALEAALD